MKYGKYHYIFEEIPDYPSQELDDLIKEIKVGERDKISGYPIIHLDNLKDIIYYLDKLKIISEMPPLGKKPDYIPLGFHDLADMIGEPVYVKAKGCKGKWEIVRAVEKDCDGEYIRFKGECDYRMRITDEIYRTKKGAEENG